jgi:hypothetical protein
MKYWSCAGLGSSSDFEWAGGLAGNRTGLFDLGPGAATLGAWDEILGRQSLCFNLLNFCLRRKARHKIIPT